MLIQPSIRLDSRVPEDLMEIWRGWRATPPRAQWSQRRHDTPAPPMKSISDLSRLTEITARLRHPEHACPRDLEQSFATIAPYTSAEAYEVAEATERGEPD